MKKISRVWFFILTLLVAGLALLSVFGVSYYYGDNLNVVFRNAENIRLGMDIGDGVEAIFAPESGEATSEQMISSKGIIERRMNAMGLSDREIYLDYAEALITIRYPLKSNDPDFNMDNAIGELQSIASVGLLTYRDTDGNIILDASTDVANAYVQLTGSGYVVCLRLTGEGAEKYSNKTGLLPGQNISIYLDSSSVTSFSNDGTTQISQDAIYIPLALTAQGARNLSEIVNAGPLPFTLVADSYNTISAAPGAQIPSALVWAGICALAALCFLMIVRYRVPGITAALVLIGQAAAMLLILSLSQYTLTLAGVAGFILSLVMLCDCNFIVAEKIKEEIGTDRSVASAIAAAYRRSLPAVIDSNLLALFITFILLITGSEVVKSFAVPLMIGIFLNFIFGLGFSSVITKVLARFRVFRDTSMYAMDTYEAKIQEKSFNFFGRRKIAWCAVAGLAVLSIAFAFIWGGVNLDIQFKGGTIVQYSYSGEIDTAKVKSAVKSTLNNTVTVQKLSDYSTGEAGTTRIAINFAEKDSLSPEKQDALNNVMTENFPENEIVFKQTTNVEPAFRRAFLLNNGLAVLISFVFIMLYIAVRFRKIGGWSVGLSSLIALLSSIISVVTAYLIFKIPMNNGILAVMLTAAGFSLIDAIVLYSRVRDNKSALGAKVPLEDLMNRSVSQTFGRTLSVCGVMLVFTLAVLICALIYGLTAIAVFAGMMMFGIVAAALSTFYVAGPLWILWQKRKQRKEEEARQLRGKSKRPESSSKAKSRS